LNLLNRFSKNTGISKLMQIHPVEARLFCVDRQIDKWMDKQTDMIKLIIAFHNFVNTPKKKKAATFI